MFRAYVGLTFAILALQAAVPAAALAEGDASRPYVYQRGGHGVPGELSVEVETAYGSRDARPFGAEGVEQGARVAWSPLSWLRAEGWSGVLFTGGAYRATASAVDLHFGLLNQDDHYLNLSLSGGYLFDYQQVHVPRFRATIDRSWGAFDTSLSSLVEIPAAGDRDTIDLVMALAASYRVAAWTRVGIEIEGQDLEGFWEADEAEGGAKLVLGPTVWFRLWESLTTKANVGAIIPATTNKPTNVTPQADNSAFDYGVLGRVTVGWSFE